MIELWLQTAAIFVLAVAYVLMAAKLAGLTHALDKMAGWQGRIERLERYIAKLEAAGREMLIATGKLKPNDRPIAETDWLPAPGSSESPRFWRTRFGSDDDEPELPPPQKHREIKS